MSKRVAIFSDEAVDHLTIRGSSMPTHATPIVAMRKVGWLILPQNQLTPLTIAHDMPLFPCL